MEEKKGYKEGENDKKKVGEIDKNVTSCNNSAIRISQAHYIYR